MRPNKLPLAVSLSLPLLLLSGCGHPNPDEVIDVVFDPCEPLVIAVHDARSDEQRRGVEDGVALWNDLLGSKLTLDEVEDAARVPLYFDDAARAFRGYYDDEEAMVFINDELVGREIVITVAHELGHTFGLYHVDEEERPSVMNHGNLEHAPNESDLRAVQEIWGSCPEE